MESGRSPKISCKARGWPTPRTSWWRNGSQIHNGDYYYSYIVYHSADNIVSLVIIAIEGFHHGTYTCRADNLFGTSVADITFMVKRKYTFSSIYDSLIVDLNISSRPDYLDVCLFTYFRSSDIALENWRLEIFIISRVFQYRMFRNLKDQFVREHQMILKRGNKQTNKQTR